jgi:hypothetical protein
MPRRAANHCRIAGTATKCRGRAMLHTRIGCRSVNHLKGERGSSRYSSRLSCVPIAQAAKASNFRRFRVLSEVDGVIRQHVELAQFLHQRRAAEI